MTEVIAFLSGVGVALVGAITALWLQRSKERKDRIERAQFQIYMRLLDISNHYFYVASVEVDPENGKVDGGMKLTIQEKAWALLDQLREEDRVEDRGNMLRHMSESFDNATQRHDAMTALIKRLGQRVAPRFSELAERISSENLLKLGQPPSPGKRTARTAPSGLWP